MAILAAAVAGVAGQPAPLTVVSAGPRGEIARLADADQIRIVFSEPMVALGAVPPGTAPAWVRITPAATGSFYWSGTKTLIFSPDADAPLPFATTFTVRIDAGTASASGRTLAVPYEFTFSTPSVRLVSANLYRRDGRYDSPAVIALRFNQPMTPAGAIAQTQVRFAPHAWKAPLLSARARAHLLRTDPAGLQRFDAKVAAVRRVTARTEAVGVRLARSWDDKQYPPSPDLVVIETTAPPPPDAWLRIDTRGAQSTVVKLEPAFFVEQLSCESGCMPAYDPLHLTGGVSIGSFAQALTIADVTGSTERPVAPARGVSDDKRDVVTMSPIPSDGGFSQQPYMSTWRLRLAADLRAADGQTLGYAWTGFVETGHAFAALSLDGSVLEAGGARRAPFFTRNVQSLLAAFAAVTPDTLVARLLEGLNPPPKRSAKPSTSSPAPAPRTLDVTPDVVQLHALDLSPWLSPAGTGLVWTDVSIGQELQRTSMRGGRAQLEEIVSPWANRSERGVLQVTNLGITVKNGWRSTLVFVTRLDSGEPVAGARVTILDAIADKRVDVTTDRDGVATTTAVTLRLQRDPWKLGFVVTAEKDGDVAFLTSTERRVDIKPWGGATERTGPLLRGSVFTDRSVYKPGEEVHLKTVLREDAADGVALLPPGTPLDVVVEDVRGREVDRRRIAANRWSSAEWTWRAPSDAAFGYYLVGIARVGQTGDDNGAVRGGFRVEEFRRPDFRVDATLTSESPILGSTLRGTIDAGYLFGAPLASRPVHWFYRRLAVQQPPDAVRARYPEDRYAIGYLPPEDEGDQRSALPIAATGTLSAAGRLAVTIPTIAGDDHAYSYDLEADVEGVSRQHVANRTSFIVHPSSIYVALSRPPLFVDTKAGARVNLSAVDLSGRPAAGVSVAVSLLREEWKTEPPSGGRSVPTWVRREADAGHWTVETTAGDTTLPVPVVQGGSYTLRAVARDSAGRQTRTDVHFYAFGGGVTSWAGSGTEIDLVPEKTTWKAGDTARVLIQSPWPHATALLTVEREGIRSYRRFAVDSTQDVVEVPLTAADAPNVYVSVLLIKGRTTTDTSVDVLDSGAPSYRVGYTELAVEDPSKRLEVSVSADRREYTPHDPAVMSVAVTSRDGPPPQSEVTLWAVDQGVLSLTGYRTPDLLAAIYVPRQHDVSVGDTREHLIRRVPPDFDGGMFGGLQRGVMGGQVGGVFDTHSAPLQSRTGGPEDTVDGVRQDFRSLVFWLGSATTDATGHVTTNVTLPDSLTTYRIMAVAANDSSQFGFGEHDIRVTKPLTLLTAFPRFLNAGDHAAVGAVVTNASAADGVAEIAVQSLDPAMLQFAATRQTIRLAPGASQSVTFAATATGPGDARVRVSAMLGAEKDAVQAPITVALPLGRETTAAYGDTVSSSVERLALPAGSLPDRGGLTVDLSSTALVGLGAAARYLDEYPFDCAEQKASRALALMLTADVGGAFTLPNVKPADYRTEAAKLLRDLRRNQCYDGGFSLWSGPCDTGSAYLTAYILHVMRIARTQQIALDESVIKEALEFLEQQLSARRAAAGWGPVLAVSDAFTVSVLAEYGRKPRAGIDQLAAEVDRLPIAALSYLLDAMIASGDNGPRRHDLERRLANAARVNGDRAHIEERDEDALMWLWNTNVTSTAVVLGGLARRKDASPLAAPFARWLVAAQTNGRWGTTHENALALEALVAYYRTFEGEAPRMTARVSVGTTAAGAATFDGRSTSAQQIQLSMSDLSRAAASSPTLSISRSGTGRLFYAARVDSFARPSPDAADRGIQVARRYERYVADGAGTPATTFDNGDLIRVTVTLTVRGEGRYLALTDPLPAGLEPLEDWALTTSSELAARATRNGRDDNWLSLLRGGYFDHVEKHDDRVVAFATRLGSGRHEFSYLVRATTAGTFEATGATAQAMYAPDVSGRSAAASVTVR